MKPLIIIAGPTAVGKSAFSVKLARKINGSIISADSMQVYKGMDIGSAKITTTEMQGIKHYLIDICDPRDDYNVFLFQKAAKEALSEIYDAGKIPILTGGTGFYIQALLYDIDFDETAGEETRFRKELEAEALDKGSDFLYARLQEVDPESCETIHKNNTKRIIRALEYFLETGEKISTHNENERKKPPAYNSAYFVLNDERALIYKRIDERVDVMLKEGLLCEVKALKDLGLTKENVSMQGLGYKELLMYLDGEISYDDAVYMIKRDSRHFAKRQLTWFNREKDIIWLNKNDFNYNDEAILDFVIAKLIDKGIYEDDIKK